MKGFCNVPVSLGRHEVALAPAALMLSASLRQDALLHVCRHPHPNLHHAVRVANLCHKYQMLLLTKSLSAVMVVSLALFLPRSNIHQQIKTGPTISYRQAGN